MSAPFLTSSPQSQWRRRRSSPPLVTRASPDRVPFSASRLKLPVNGSALFSGNRNSLRCNSSTTPGGPDDNESRTILDAFFLGKALAEALNERIESTVGEILSSVGRLQAEQQKQVQEFQEEVLERAKRAKEKAAREAMETQGSIPKSSTVDISNAGNGATSSSTSTAGPQSVSPAVSTTLVDSGVQSSNSDDTEPLLGLSNED